MIMNISRVSRRWRQIALSRPDFFSTLDITIHNSMFRPRSGSERILRWLEWQLPFTRAAPIDISLHVDASRLDGKDLLTRVMELLSPHLSRCRTLYIKARHVADFDDIFEVFPDVDMPLLQNLLLSTFGDFVVHLLPFPGARLRLKTLTLQSAVVQLCMSDGIMKTLSRLHLESGYFTLSPERSSGRGVSDVPQGQELIRVEMLQEAVNLESLSLSCVRMKFADTGNRAKLSRLRTLRLQWDPFDPSCASMKILLQRIRMPVLREFYLRGIRTNRGSDEEGSEDEDDVRPMLDDVLDLMGRQQAKLRVIKIRDGTFEDETLHRLLKVSPLLHTLTLENTTISEKVLRYLHPATELCMELSDLQLVDKLATRESLQGYKPYTLSTLQQVVIARHNSGRRLKKLSVKGWMEKGDSKSYIWTNPSALGYYVEEVVRDSPHKASEASLSGSFRQMQIGGSDPMEEE